MNIKKIAILVCIISIISLWFILELDQVFTLEYAQSQQSLLSEYIQNNLYQASFIYFISYILITAFSLPGAAIATLLGAGLFGFSGSLLLISFASSIGASCAFLLSRYLFREWVEKKFGYQLEAFHQGIEKDGDAYLLSLRLLPLFPFFLINILMGLTRYSLLRFYVVSQIGMLPGTIIYINAGTQLSQINTLNDILSFNIIASLTLLGLFPLIMRNIMSIFKNYKRYSKWTKPTHFDRNLIAIGAGSGGLVTAYISAAVNAKVTLIEKHKMGGDCLNTGCVPSKALLRSAKAIHEIKKASQLGIQIGHQEVDFAQVMARVQQVIAQVEPHDSIERYTDLGVECIQGNAKILSPWSVEVNGEVLTTRNIVISTGARPFVPPIEGLDQVDYLTSDNIWTLQTQPKKLVIMGGGPIGCELAQAFALLGSNVTLIEKADQLLGREDPEVGQFIYEALEKSGVKVLLSTSVSQFTDSNKLKMNFADGIEVSMEFDQIMIALGRKANITGFGLEELDIEFTSDGRIQVDPYLRTNYPNIFAVGDVTGPYQLTHAAGHQAWYAAVNALFGDFKKFKVNYSALPAVTYTIPEVARVGINEIEAKQQKIDYEVTHYGIDDLDRAIADSEAYGFIKVITPKGKDKILGATIVGHHGGELLSEFTLAMRYGLGLNKILSTIHPYPTFSEANKYAAGVWKKAHAPKRILEWLKCFHAWKRKENKANIEDTKKTNQTDIKNE